MAQALADWTHKGFGSPRDCPEESGIQGRNVGSEHPHGQTLTNGTQDSVVGEGAERCSFCLYLSPMDCSIWPSWRHLMNLKLSELASKNTHTKAACSSGIQIELGVLS